MNDDKAGRIPEREALRGHLRDATQDQLEALAELGVWLEKHHERVLMLGRRNDIRIGATQEVIQFMFDSLNPEVAGMVAGNLVKIPPEPIPINLEQKEQTDNDYSVHKKKLQKIATVVRSAQVSQFNNPAGYRVLLGGFIGFIMGLPLEFSWYGIITSCLLGCVIGYFWMRRAKYQTWHEHIYALLADYDPVNKTAYASLQEEAKRGDLKGENILEWIAQEDAYVGAFRRPPSQARTNQNKTRDRFISKKT